MGDALHILCVEDNPSDFLLIERELRKLAQPVAAVCVEERTAFEQSLDRQVPDVILCDHNLPSFSSNEAFGIVKSRGLRVPFILVTATMGEDEGVRQVNEGIHDYIMKDRLGRLPSAVARAVRFVRMELETEKYYHTIISSERRFRAIVENSSEAVLFTDDAFSVSYASPSFPRIFHMPMGQVPATSVLQLALPEHRDALLEACRSATGTGRPVTRTFQAHSPAGSELWIECTISDLTGDPHLRALVWNMKDVSARVASERDRQRTQAVLTSIIENTRIGYVLVDPGFRVVAFNQAAVDRYLLEFGKPLMEKAFIFDYLPDERRQETMQRYQTALQGDNLRYEISFQQKDGSTNWYDVMVFRVMEKDDRLLGFIIATDDITHRKTAELEKDRLTTDLMTRNKDLTQFSMIISHNLRAPVATIMGLAMLLERKDTLSAGDLDRCLTGIVSAARNIDQIIRDLTDILQKKRALSDGKELVWFSSLLDELRETLKAEIGEHHVSIRPDFKTTSCLCIRSYIHSIFLNLISNSIRYRRPDLDPLITITAETVDNALKLTFTDNGLGIDLETHGEKMFGLYKKFHLHADGRGMGLYMVKTQVELMGGRVTVESTPNQGTTFTVLLPVDTA